MLVAENKFLLMKYLGYTSKEVDNMRSFMKKAFVKKIRWSLSEERAKERKLKINKIYE